MHFGVMITKMCNLVTCCNSFVWLCLILATRSNFTHSLLYLWLQNTKVFYQGIIKHFNSSLWTICCSKFHVIRLFYYYKPLVFFIQLKIYIFRLFKYSWLLGPLKKTSFLTPCLIDTSTFTTRNHNLFDEKCQ